MVPEAPDVDPWHLADGSRHARRELPADQEEPQ